jgi:hypothetical protein
MSDLNEDQLAELSDEELEAEFNRIKQEELGDSDTDGDSDIEPNVEDDNSGDEDVDATEPEATEDDSETSEDVVDEVDGGNEETSKEEEGQPDEEPSDSKDDTKSDPTETLELKPLKIDGKEIPVQSIDELYALASAGGKFTQKMQAISKFKKAYMIMEKQGLSDEDISLLAEAKSCNKDAIAMLIKQAGVDPLDLDEGPSDNYRPGAFVPSDTAVALEEVEREISVDPEYAVTSNIVNNVLDERSQEMLVQNPNLIRGIHQDIKSGAFQHVMAEAEKLKLMDGARRADFEYYLIAAKQDAVGTQDYAPQAPEPQQVEQQIEKKPAVSKSKRRAAGSSRSKVPPKSGPINWDELSDEELMAKREEILARY